jgi:hypothetical protein
VYAFIRFESGDRLRYFVLARLPGGLTSLIRKIKNRNDE